MRKKLILSVLLIASVVSAQTTEKSFSKKYVFGNIKTSEGTTKIDTTGKYSDTKGYGLTTFGSLKTNFKDAKTSFIASNKPFYFSVRLPEGHYKVILTLGGSPEGSSTTVKAESRRLMLENIKTEQNRTEQKTIIVDVRTPQINDSTKIKLKPRELVYKNWDNKLTLEFNGKFPCISAIEIQKDNELPTIFLAGNSTVTDQEYEPWCSWGQIFPRFLKPNVVVANYAESGETLLAFKREKRLQKLLSQMKKGDYLFIEFAHDDQKPGGNHLDPFTTYKAELKYYIAKVREKGGNPVLVTSMHRRNFDENGKVLNTLGDYPEAMRQTAREEHVPLIDLNAMSKIFYEAMGPENSTKAFVHYPAHTFPGQEKALADNTHFNPYGAYELARCIVSSIIQQNLSLKKYLIDQTTIFNPAKPDPFNRFIWYNSPAVELLKPDGN